MGTFGWRQRAGSTLALSFPYRGNKDVSYVCGNLFFSCLLFYFLFQFKKRSHFEKIENKGLKIFIAIHSLRDFFSTEELNARVS